MKFIINFCNKFYGHNGANYCHVTNFMLRP